MREQVHRQRGEQGLGGHEPVGDRGQRPPVTDRCRVLGVGRRHLSSSRSAPATVGDPDCKRLAGQRGRRAFPDPRTAGGRGRRGNRSTSAAPSRGPCSRSCSSTGARWSPTTGWSRRSGPVARRAVRSARCAPTCRGCAPRSAPATTGCGTSSPATGSPCPTTSWTPPSSSGSGRRAGRDRRRGPPAGAARCWISALGRWRGDALAEFAELDAAVAEAARLDGAAAGRRGGAGGRPAAAGPAPGGGDRRGAAGPPLPDPGADRAPADAGALRGRPPGRRPRGLPPAATTARRRARRSCRRRRRRRSTSRSSATIRPCWPPRRDGNLPRRATGFVGRGREIDDCRRGADGRAAGHAHRGRRGRQVAAGRGGRAPRSRPLPRRRVAVRAGPARPRRPGRRRAWPRPCRCSSGTG